MFYKFNHPQGFTNMNMFCNSILSYAPKLQLKNK